MGASLSKITNTLIQYILQYTLHDIMQSSNDFEDVKIALTERTYWSIDLFRSCLTMQLGSSGGCFLTLCALSFLVMAENVYMHYGRLSPAELKARAENMGYVTFAFLFAILDVGIVIVRISGLVMLSGSPALATSLVLVSMLPPIILPMLAYPARLLRKKSREPRVDSEMGTSARWIEMGVQA